MTRFEFLDGMLTFTDCVSGEGWHRLTVALNETISTSYKWKVTTDGGTTTAVGLGDGYSETLRFIHRPEQAVLIVERIITNTSLTDLALNSIEDGILSPDGRLTITAGDSYRLRYLHTANVRLERFPQSRPEYPYVRMVPVIPTDINRGEANDVPALILCDEKYETLLIEGDLRQLKYARSWILGASNHAGRNPEVYRGQQRLLGSEPAILQPGQAETVSTVFYQIKHDAHPHDCLLDYFSEIASRYRLCGQHSPMRRGAVYCTWNFGVLDKIDESTLRKRIAIVGKRFPSCSFFLIDDGYQALRNGRNAGIDSFYPSPCEGYDKEKFPRGMKFIAEEIQCAGMQPAIWLSPKVYLDSALAREHPEWLLRDNTGDIHLIGASTYLDLSVESARNFFLQVLDTLLVDWGFHGIKFDFMTQWFLLDKARFRSGSGIEWRDSTYGQIRQRIGDDGLFMICIAMSMGNPFQGLYADCYRCGCDIHDGTWSEEVRACKATLPQILQPGAQTLLLNMDSAGCADAPENEIYFRLNWVFITQGVLEIGGKVESMSEKHMEMLGRILANPDRGNRVRCADDRAFTGIPLPEALVVDYSSDGPTVQSGVIHHVGLFNWSETTKAVSCPTSMFTRQGEALDFWSGEAICTQNGLIVVVLPPHTSRLITINA